MLCDLPIDPEPEPEQRDRSEAELSFGFYDTESLADELLSNEEIKENSKRNRVIQLIEEVDEFSILYKSNEEKKKHFNSYNIVFRYFERTCRTNFPSTIITYIYHKIDIVYVKDILKWINDVHKLREEYPFEPTQFRTEDREVLLFVCEVFHKYIHQYIHKKYRCSLESFCVEYKIKYFSMDYINKREYTDTLVKTGKVLRVLCNLIVKMCDDILVEKGVPYWLELDIKDAPFYKYDMPELYSKRNSQPTWINAVIWMGNDCRDWYEIMGDVHTEYWGGICCEVYDDGMTNYLLCLHEDNKYCIVRKDKKKEYTCQKGFLLGTLYYDCDYDYDDNGICVQEFIDRYEDNLFSKRVNFIIRSRLE